MGEAPLTHGRGNAKIFLAHFSAFLFVILAAYWLRRIALQPDAILQGYLQVISALLAFVFAAVTLVRFQGTQDRISLILGAGFLLSGAVLTATSILFFQIFPEAPLRILWAPLTWWLGRHPNIVPQKNQIGWRFSRLMQTSLIALQLIEENADSVCSC